MTGVWAQPRPEMQAHPSRFCGHLSFSLGRTPPTDGSLSTSPRTSLAACEAPVLCSRGEGLRFHGVGCPAMRRGAGSGRSAPSGREERRRSCCRNGKRKVVWSLSLSLALGRRFFPPPGDFVLVEKVLSSYLLGSI